MSKKKRKQEKDQSGTGEHMKGFEKKMNKAGKMLKKRMHE